MNEISRQSTITPLALRTWARNSSANLGSLSQSGHLRPAAQVENEDAVRERGERASVLLPWPSAWGRRFAGGQRVRVAGSRSTSSMTCTAAANSSCVFRRLDLGQRLDQRGVPVDVLAGEEGVLIADGPPHLAQGGEAFELLGRRGEPSPRRASALRSRPEGERVRRSKRPCAWEPPASRANLRIIPPRFVRGNRFPGRFPPAAQLRWPLGSRLWYNSDFRRQVMDTRRTRRPHRRAAPALPAAHRRARRSTCSPTSTSAPC